MSNTIAIATVTATLRNVLQAALNAVTPPISANVITFNPADKKGTRPFVNVFLYHVTTNAALRNLDAPTRGINGTAIQRPQAALNLHYLISCAADDAFFGGERLLGTVVSTLHAQPMLTRDLIAQSIKTVASSDASLGYLAQSDLAAAIDLVKLTPEDLSTEELSKIWSIFFQVPYLLSVSYVASVVMLEGRVSPSTALPVRSRGAYVIAGQRPLIESIIVQADASSAALLPPSPITAGSALYVRGQHLSADDVHVVFPGVDVSIPRDDVTGEQIAVALPALAAGVAGVQVVHRIPMGDPLAAHRGSESNVFPIVLHPIVTAINKANQTSRTVDGTLYHSADVKVTVTPDIGLPQRVSLLLNQLVPAPAPPANAYTFDAPARDPNVDPPTSPTITIPIKDVLPGTYVVRLLVDGAESVPSGGMNAPYPQVVIP